VGKPAASTNARPSKVAAKLIAAAALGAAALLFYYFAHIPVASDIGSRKWNASPSDELVIAPFGKGTLPFVSVEGRDNEGLDVRFDRAQVRDSDAASLKSDFHLDIPTTVGQIGWTTVAKGDGHTGIDITVDASAGMPEMRIEHVGEGEHPGLRLSSANAAMTVQLVVAMGDDDASHPAHEQKALQFGRTPAIKLPGAIPLTIIVPAGGAVAINFPVEQPKSVLHLGAADGADASPTGIQLHYLGLRQIGGDTYGQYACAASPGAHRWLPHKPRPDDCAASPDLRATRLTLTADSIALTAAGSAFFASDGVFEVDDWLEKLWANKPLSAFLGVVLAALATWVWKTLSSGGRDVKPSEVEAFGD
jgi:hypothetical protein